MGTLTLTRKYDTKRIYRDVTMVIEVPDDADLAELHYDVKKFMIALGYSPDGVDRMFGEDEDFS